MRAKIYTLLTLFLLPSIVAPKSKSSSNKADSSNTVSIDLPSVKIHNNGAKKASITGITIDYKITNEKNKKSVTTAANIPIPAKKGKTFNLKLKLPISSGDKGTSAVPLGISKIKVESNDLEISPSWTGLSDSTTTIAGSEKIFIHQTGSSWELDKEAMIKSAKNNGKHKTKHHKHTKKTKDTNNTNNKEHPHDKKKESPSHPKDKKNKSKDSTSKMLKTTKLKNKHSSNKKTKMKKKSKNKDPMEEAMASMKKTKKSKPMSMMEVLNKKHGTHASAKTSTGKKDSMLAEMEKAAGKK